MFPIHDEVSLAFLCLAGAIALGGMLMRRRHTGTKNAATKYGDGVTSAYYGKNR
jgi:hypothetical protein